MSVFEHSRWKIFNPAQHPLIHSIDDFGYMNNRLPGISRLSDTMDYLVSVLWPNYIGTFADQAALAAHPAPVANDYAVVTDDGDGKSAGYVYTTLDGAAQWVKRYDVDWSLEGIFAETINRTQYMYVAKYGFSDHDSAGTALVGIYAGQTIYGGNLTNQNLTLNANAADATGYVQTDNHFRPTTDNALDLGTTVLKFRTGYFKTSVLASTMTLSGGTIADSSGALTFGALNLSTTGTLATGTITRGTLTLAAASITDSTHALSFGDNNLTTTGEMKAATAKFSSSLEVGPFAGAALIFAAGSITDESGGISFDNENLVTTGTLGAGDSTFTRVDADNLRLDGNTLSVQNAGGSLVIAANGAGVVNVTSAMTTIAQTITGVLGVVGSITIDNLSLDGNVLATTNVNGDLTFTPNGSGTVISSSILKPGGNNTLTLGTAAARWSTLFLGTGIGDGTNSITIANLLTFRSVGSPSTGDALFWDGSKWVASAPDTEITHSTISGLTTSDAGHTQFVMLAGRSGGQAVQGGTAASENLTLESTAHATKGFIGVKDNLVANTNASFSATWSGIDLGDATHYFRDIYTQGVHKGLRLETYTSGTLPGASASKVGRLAWSSDDNSVYVDRGGTWGKLAAAQMPTLVVQPKSALFTASVADDIYECTAGAGGYTATLPASAGCSGKVFIFKKVDSDVGLVTVDANAAELIEGQLTYVLTNQYDSVMIYSNGTGWGIIA